MQKKEKINIKKLIIEILGTILGSFIMAIGISLFLLPNQLSSGGVAGIATVIYYLFNLPMGTMIIIINIPLFIIAIFKIGKTFFTKAVIGTVALSIFIDLLEKIEALTTDKLLACIYGGIIIGIRNSTNIKNEFINRRNRFNKQYNKKIQTNSKNGNFNIINRYNNSHT